MERRAQGPPLHSQDRYDFNGFDMAGFRTNQPCYSINNDNCIDSVSPSSQVVYMMPFGSPDWRACLRLYSCFGSFLKQMMAFQLAFFLKSYC
jgi:hypothetical protein